MDISNKKKGTVLLVDDEPNILTALRRLIRGEATHILCTTRAEEALQILADKEVDVLITDARMPGMNGIELLEEAARLRPNCYRILMSGHVAEADQQTMIREGFIQAYMAKPWQNDLFCQLVKQGLH